MFKKILFYCLLSPILLFASDYRLADFDFIVGEALEKFHVPGVAVGLVVDGKIVLAKGFGARNYINKAPVTERTLFSIASCTKAFTAMVLAQLVEEGVIAWDEPVVKYIPEFCLFDPQSTAELTLRDLVAHRTGVPRHDAIWYCHKKKRDEVLRALPFLEPVSKLRERWHYNNTMYSVAGIAIERIIGQSWEEAVTSRIFFPLEMFFSQVSLTHLPKKNDVALPHAEIEGVVKTIPFHSLDALEPGGAIVSNLVDMMKWVKTQLAMGTKLVTKAALEEMHTPQITFSLNEAQEIGITHRGYGLGWYVGNFKECNLIRHAGIIDGYHAEVVLLPEKKMGIVVLCNSSSDGYFATAVIRNTLLDRFLGKEGSDWMVVVHKVRAQAKSALVWPKKSFLNPSYPLAFFAGSYVHPAYGVVHIYDKGNQLFAAYGDTLTLLHSDGPLSFQGQVRNLLVFGISRIIDFKFSTIDFEQCDEVHISFEPSAKPLTFKRVH